MSVHRSWLVAAVGLLGASGLILGGLGDAVSADDVSGTGQVGAWADVQGNCLNAGVSTDEASVGQTGGTEIDVSVCLEDVGGSPLPEDPDDVVPGDLDDVVPGDLDDVMPGDLDDVIPGDPDEVIPGDPDEVIPGDPGGGVPGGPGGGDPGEVIPGNLGDVVANALDGLVPDGIGVDPGVLERIPDVVPGGNDVGRADGNDDTAPTNRSSGNEPLSGSVDVGGADWNEDVPTAEVLESESVPGPSSGGTLPRTGGGLGTGVLRFIAVFGFGRGIFGWANRRRRAHA